MHREIVSCEETREIAGIRLTPIVRSFLTWADIDGTITFYAYRQPTYLLVERYSVVQVMTISGEEITLRQIYSECPAIREVLAARYPALLELPN